MLGKRCLTEGSMDTSRSPALEPVCEGLRTRFEPEADWPSGDLTRILEAVDDAYSRGELFAADAAAPGKHPRF